MVITISVMLFLLLGCSKGSDPTVSEIQEPALPKEVDSDDSRGLFGLWSFICDPDTESIEVIMLRDAELHLNALKFLEPPPLLFLTLESAPQFNGNILDVDIGLRNPYLGLDLYSGFDVCGIVFTHGSLTGFNDPELVMAGEGDTRLLNADGYSRWWNPAEFPHVTSVFGYKDGLLGEPADNADFNCTINGYKYFTDGLDPNAPLTALNLDNRGLFRAGQQNIRHYTIDISGGLIFNYAVDANWKKIPGGPPYIIPNDFPPGANRREAYNVTVAVLENTLFYEESTGDAGGDLRLLMRVWDHFDSSLNAVSSESLAGIPSVTVAIPIDSGDGYSTYELSFVGDDLTLNGDAELLITVRSEGAGYGGLIPGKPLCAYFMYTFNIMREDSVDPCDPDLDPPNTFINSGCGDQPFGTTEVVLVVSGFDPNYCTSLEDLTYEWRKAFDGGVFDEWLPDPGPELTITELFEGDWAFEVRAVDEAGNKDQTSAKCFLNIEDPCDPDLDPPETFIDHGCEDIEDQYATEIILGVSGIDPYNCTLPEDLTYEWRKAVDGEGFDDWQSDPGPELLITELFPGDWVIEVSALDAQMNKDPTPAICSFNIYDPCDPDMDVPDTFIDYGCEDQPSGTAYIVLGVSGTDPNNCTSPEDLTYEWRKALDGGEFDSWHPDPGPDVLVPSLIEGDWQIEVRAIDLAGNVDPSPAVCSFNITNSFLDGWAVTWGGYEWDQVQGLAVDNSNNVYVTGFFEEYTDFDPGPGEDWHFSDGMRDSFLAKFDTNGNFLWAHTWGDWYPSVGYGIAVDDLGNVYVAGDFDGTVDFDPGPGVEERTSEGNDAFLCKFSSNGDFLWVRTWGHYVFNHAHTFIFGVAVDSYGNIYPVGTFTQTVDFDPGPGGEVRDATNPKDCYMSKFNPDGDFIWVRTWDATKTGAITVDSVDKIYVTGEFSDTVDFDPGPGVDMHQAVHGPDVFLSKFNIDGDYYWARTWGGIGDDQGFGVAASATGDVYVTGVFENTVDFDPGAGVEERESLGEIDIFLCRYDTDGDYMGVMAWGGSSFDYGSQTCVFGSEAIYVTGNFTGTVDFDPDSGTDEISPIGGSDMFLSKFDSNDDYLWARHVGAQGEWISPWALGVDSLGYVYIAGGFLGTIDFNPGPGEDYHTTNGYIDCFLMKLPPYGYW